MVTRKLITSMLCSAALSVNAMTFKMVSNDTLVMSGPVVDEDYARFKDVPLDRIKTIVLRNSNGGDWWTGRMLADKIRDIGAETVVSGYCISACAHMFLGGTSRFFSSDYPVKQTYIAFHGVYSKETSIHNSAQSFQLYHNATKLNPNLDKDFVKFYSDIQLKKGLMVLFPTTPTKNCIGTEKFRPRECGLSEFTKSPLELGVITSTVLKTSPDASTVTAQLHNTQVPEATKHDDVNDISLMPVKTKNGIISYKQFLDSNFPRAFAVSDDNRYFAFNSGRPDVMENAVRRCMERATGNCRLYAVDGSVVYEKLD